MQRWQRWLSAPEQWAVTLPPLPRVPTPKPKPEPERPRLVSLLPYCQTDEERRALRLLWRCLTPEQREDFVETHAFVCDDVAEVRLVLVETSAILGLDIVNVPQIRVRIFPHLRAYERAAALLANCAGRRSTRVRDVKERPWLCVHAQYAGSQMMLPWPDRMLTYKLAIEDGSIWPVTGLLTRSVNS
jgi:hypothetical protein